MTTPPTLALTTPPQVQYNHHDIVIGIPPDIAISLGIEKREVLMIDQNNYAVIYEYQRNLSRDEFILLIKDISRTEIFIKGPMFFGGKDHLAKLRDVFMLAKREQIKPMFSIDFDFARFWRLCVFCHRTKDFSLSGGNMDRISPNGGFLVLFGTLYPPNGAN